MSSSTAARGTVRIGIVRCGGAGGWVCVSVMSVSSVEFAGRAHFVCSGSAGRDAFVKQGVRRKSFLRRDVGCDPHGQQNGGCGVTRGPRPGHHVGREPVSQVFEVIVESLGLH